LKRTILFIAFVIICSDSYSQCISGNCEWGKGTYHWANGDRYEGDWVNDQMNGKGIFFWADGDRYEGDWVNDQMNGKGIFFWADGDRYEGDWVNDQMNGKGIFFWADGDRYEGDWVNDQMNGKGIFFWADGDRYEGDWVNGKSHGKGTQYWWSGGRYEGDWVNDQMNGKGTKYWANGDRYEGDVVNDKMNGKGTKYWANGDRYEGDVVNDKMNGKANYYWAEGSCMIGGNYYNDKYVEGTGTYYSDCSSSLVSNSKGSFNEIKIFENESGLFEIPITINGVLKIFFILDSQASEVSVAPDVALTLFRTGTIHDSDWLPGAPINLPEGNIADSYRFNIRKLQLGSNVLHNVSASISNSVEASMLLGQNVLRELGKIQIDYQNNSLKVFNNPKRSLKNFLHFRQRGK